MCSSGQSTLLAMTRWERDRRLLSALLQRMWRAGNFNFDAQPICCVCMKTVPITVLKDKAKQSKMKC